jgi:group II intron reverse transcriptase/maturase
MRDAKTVLEIVHERGKRGLPLEDVYRMLYNPHLYMLAYSRLYRNKGSMTPGMTADTVDGMNLERIRLIIDSIRHEQYRWTPVKRVYIQKKNGKKRPLGMPTWSDKLVQEVMRLILEAYYEPQFSRHSHGFRPNRGCATALKAIERPWTGTKWFIEGDIKGCFDNIDHKVLLTIIAEKIQDNRFMQFLSYMLKAGYAEDWKYHPTLSGTPQGGIISPILSNIYLDKLDRFVEDKLLPTYNRGKRRRENPTYGDIRIALRKAKREGDTDRIRSLIKQRRTMPSLTMDDPDYRRLRYVRYADDFILGFAGPKAEAQEIKEKLQKYLQDNLKLELSTEKTLITHAKSKAARFLGYDIQIRHDSDRIDDRGRRSVTEHIELRVPRDVVEANVAKRTAKGKPIHRTELMDCSDYYIVRRYQDEYRGVVNYYLMTRNVRELAKYHVVMQTSLLRTLAAKHKTTTTKLAAKLKATTETPHGPMTVLRVEVPRGDRKPLVAEFGGIPLRKQEVTELHDRPYSVWASRSELVTRLLKQKCEMCGRTDVELADLGIKLGRLEVHHIRKLAHLQPKGRRELPEWKKRMTAMRRKTLIVCVECHDNIHAGRPCRPYSRKESEMDIVSGEPDTLKGVRPVRGGADGKGQ